jgi:putative transcriptional regulator
MKNTLKKNDNEKSFGELLITAYNEVLADVEGRKVLKGYVKKNIPKIKTFSNEEIKTLRNDINCTQEMFANILGVTKKTIEAWEHGSSKPNGSALRLLALIDKKKNDFFENDLKLIGV